MNLKPLPTPPHSFTTCLYMVNCKYEVKQQLSQYTSRPALDRIFLAWTPSGSWLTSITSLFPRILRVSLLADRISHPISKGACQNKDSNHHNMKVIEILHNKGINCGLTFTIAQILKCDRYSSKLMPPLPTSNMSGSIMNTTRNSLVKVVQW